MSSEHQPWNPSGASSKGNPTPERPAQDLRWRPARAASETPHGHHERSWKAVSDQCMNAKVPGYTGFVPSATAEHIFGHTSASVGRTAVLEQLKRHQQPNLTLDIPLHLNATDMTGQCSSKCCTSKAASAAPLVESSTTPSEHPLGKSQVLLLRNHWVPTIPGYSGHIPGKNAENICGGGIIHTCKLAGRVIAERCVPTGVQSPVNMQDDAQRSRLIDFYHERNGAEGSQTAQERVKLATSIREHCSKQIPGYTGHIPRVSGESIYGGTARSTNLIAAAYCDDKIFNPESHGRVCCGPQVPGARQLRL